MYVQAAQGVFLCRSLAICRVLCKHCLEFVKFFHSLLWVIPRELHPDSHSVGKCSICQGLLDKLPVSTQGKQDSSDIFGQLL